MMKKILFIALLLGLLVNAPAQEGLIVDDGAHLKMSNGASIVLNQMDFEMNGIFSDGNDSKVKFTGGSNNGVYANSQISFYNLEISKSASTSVLLHEDILIGNNLIFSQGLLDLNGHVLELDGGQLISETSSSYVTDTLGGFIELIQTLNAPDQANPGNLGIEITSIENLGTTVIQRGHTEQSSDEGGKSILRYYDISPANNAGLNATFRIYYSDNELNGIPENELKSWRSTDGGSTWQLIEGSILNTTNNWIQLSGVDAFSRWTLASETTSPLPVELAFFKGQVKNQFNLLEWQTLSEINVEHFEIQKLENNNWMVIGNVEASHFSDEIVDYSFKDFDFKNEAYYRLRIIDFDGKEEFSEVIHIRRTDLVADDLVLYPNPAKDYVLIQHSNNKLANEVLISDTGGKLIKIFKPETDRISLDGFTPGIYFLEIRYGTHFYKKKITVQ